MSNPAKKDVAICKVCGAEELINFPEFGEFTRITSDCRPFPPGGDLAACNVCGSVQKIVSKKWLEEIRQIYGQYQAYHQAEGFEEQIVFDALAGRPRRRSDVLMERLIKCEVLSDVGVAVDVGCGNGVTLRTIGTLLPRWSLYGHDINEYQSERLREIPGFRGLLIAQLPEIQERFDLVTFIHSLEHFTDPLGALLGWSTKINNGGILFIEVCNLEDNPFDLLVADHLMHFTPETLGILVKRAGLQVISVKTNWVGKEISLICRSPSFGEEVAGTSREVAKENFKFVKSTLDWLREFVEKARDAAQKSDHFGLFGTSIAGTWLASQLGDAIDFFVDEDENRVGRGYLGKPVIRPKDVRLDATVYLALSPSVGKIIAERFSGMGFEIVTPPAR